jgi:nicotinamide mononucleotide adenylyltransferase
MLVDTASKLCDRIIILVGSAQESGTLRNPFNISTRIDIIKEIYGDSVIVKALSDLTNENDITHDWGKYVFENVDRYIYKTPELMIYGNDISRSGWFSPDDIKDTLEIIVPRSTLPISATMVREMIVKDDRKEWMKWVNPKLHKMYDQLRAELLGTKPYAEMYQKLLNKNVST